MVAADRNRIKCYEVRCDDGIRSPVVLRLTRQNLCRLIGGALFQGAVASSEIEGIKAFDIETPRISDLPESLLRFG